MMDTGPRDDWSFHNPVMIHSGHKALDILQSIAKEQNVLLVTTSGSIHRGTTEKILASFSCQPLIYDRIKPNPDIENIDQAIADIKHNKITLIVALGGGSVIDTAKALSVGIPIGEQRTIRSSLQDERVAFGCKIPLVAIPTTAGTGSEVTPFATIWDFANKKKHSLSDPLLFPDQAFLIPELTVSLPWEITLYSGLDALSHALESLWNKNRSPVTQSYAFEAIRLIIETLPQLRKMPNNLILRKQMQDASLISGLAISQTRTAIAHSMSYPITIHFGMPHGLACSFMLRDLLRYVSINGSDADQNTFGKLIPRFDEMFGQIEVEKEIAKYATSEEIIELIDEMFESNRARNFFLNIEKQDVKKMICNNWMPCFKGKSGAYNEKFSPH